VARGERVQAIVSERVTTDGRHLVVSLTLSPITAAGGEIIGVAAVGRDVTAQKQAQAELAYAAARAAAASRVKSRFIAKMNHELRTPLNGVVGVSGLLAGTQLSDEQRECIALLQSSADALTAVIDGILDFSTIEAGTVGGESEPLEVPAPMDSVMARAEHPSALEPVTPAALGRRVLVVEDDSSSRLVAVRLLQAHGLTVDAAQSGDDALAALEQADYAAVFIDCEMTGLDGFETTREIRRREGSVRHTPIIAMTAGTMPGDAERCHAAGMDYYVAKPIQPAGLDYIIARSIGDG
jgi:CheY-like chemotaxis protein